MEKGKVSCLDPWDEQIKRIVRAVAPPELEVRFAASYEPDVQYAMAIDADFIMTNFAPVTARMIEDSPRLRLIHKWGVGYEKIDTAAAKRRGVPVAIAGGMNAIPVAEHAIALMLAVYRRIPFVDRKLRGGTWLKQEMRTQCRQLRGKTIGLLGMGNIGRELARKLSVFDVEVLYHDVRRLDEAMEKALPVRYVAFDRLLAESDILSVHVPLQESTAGMVGHEAIARMKDGAVIINTARGGVVDETALYQALISGKLFGAGIDTFAVEPPPADNPLFGLEEVVLTPHTGGVVVDNVANVTIRVFENMQRLLRGEPLTPGDRVA
ncbi:MAG: 2-hydroxyacid dehydrogenase [Syntrophales bacterium]